MIRFCLDINCLIEDDDILPKKICSGCLEKLEIAFELKMKSKESDRYLKEILLNQTTENEVDEHMMTAYNPVPHFPPPNDDEDSLLEPLDDSFTENDIRKRQGEHICPICQRTFRYKKPFKNHLKMHKNEPEQQPVTYAESDNDGGSSFGAEELEPKGLRTGDYNCTTCGKTFKYIKPFKNHLKTHSVNSLAAERFASPQKKLSRNRPSSSDQAPYDDDLQTPAAFREPSPDISTMMVNANLLQIETEEEPPSKRSRTRKEHSHSRSPSIEPSQEMSQIEPKKRGRPRSFQTLSYPTDEKSLDLEAPRRSRGRPRKYPKVKMEEVPTEDETKEVEDNLVDNENLLEGFSEVDVSKMLKPRTSILDDDSLSQSAPSTSRNRSRSVSVEVVQEFDIFGEAIDTLASPVKTGFGSGVTFQCDATDCTKKFHLRANLKKHQREAHGKI